LAESAQIARVSYTHEAIADWLLANPDKKLKECADQFGYTQAWLSTVIHSDAFQVYFSQRRAALNQIIHHGISAKLQDTTQKALDILNTRLDEPEDLESEFILDVADKLLHRQGYAPGKVSLIQNNITAPVPGAVDMQTLSRARQMMQAIQTSVGNDPNIIDVVPEAEVDMLRAAQRAEDK